MRPVRTRWSQHLVRRTRKSAEKIAVKRIRCAWTGPAQRPSVSQIAVESSVEMTAVAVLVENVAQVSRAMRDSVPRTAVPLNVGKTSAAMMAAVVHAGFVKKKKVVMMELVFPQLAFPIVRGFSVGITVAEVHAVTATVG